MNFQSLLKSLELSNIIATFGSRELESVTNFGLGCDLNGSYFVLMGWPIDGIAKYDRNWNYINFTSINSPRYLLTLLINNTEVILISRYNYLSLTDANFKVFKSITVSGYNEGLYFNSFSSLLFVATSSYSVLHVFNLNLTLLRNITVKYPTKYIAEYNSSMYVSSTSSFIMVLKNEIVTLIFSTVCTTIQTFEIDQSGLMALNCFIWPSSIIYLYDSNVNGTFTGQTWVSPGIDSASIGFDFSGNLVVASPKYGIYIFGAPSLNIASENLTTYSLNDSCIFKGNIIKF